MISGVEKSHHMMSGFLPKRQGEFLTRNQNSPALFGRWLVSIFHPGLATQKHVFFLYASEGCSCSCDSSVRLCLYPTNHTLLHNTHIKGFKCESLNVWGKGKPHGHCFNLTKKKHAGPWSFDLINIIDHICAPWSNKPPPCCLLDSQGKHHFLGHCLHPSPPLGPRLTPNTHTYIYINAHTISKMAGWAGHAGGGTDVRANRIFTGGGGLTKRQRHEEGETKRVNVRFKRG